jgi:hypothetical protein
MNPMQEQGYSQGDIKLAKKYGIKLYLANGQEATQEQEKQIPNRKKSKKGKRKK